MVYTASELHYMHQQGCKALGWPRHHLMSMHALVHGGGRGGDRGAQENCHGQAVKVVDHLPRLVCVSKARINAALGC